MKYYFVFFLFFFAMTIFRESSNFWKPDRRILMKPRMYLKMALTHPRIPNLCPMFTPGDRNTARKWVNLTFFALFCFLFISQKLSVWMLLCCRRVGYECGENAMCSHVEEIDAYRCVCNDGFVRNFTVNDGQYFTLKLP